MLSKEQEQDLLETVDEIVDDMMGYNGDRIENTCESYDIKLSNLMTRIHEEIAARLGGLK